MHCRVGSRKRVYPLAISCSSVVSTGTATSRHGSMHEWVAMIGADPSGYGTHSLRRSKANLIYRQTKNLRAVQLLLGHTKLKSTLRYLGVEVDDALEIAEHTEI